MLHWQIEKIILDLKYTWKISRNASDQKMNLVVFVSDRSRIGRGEAAPNVRYNESPEELLLQFENFLSHKPETIESPEQLQSFLSGITISNALRFAIESGYLHFLSSGNDKNFYERLDLSLPADIATSYSIPMMEIGKMKEFYETNRLERFPFIKLKINDESGTDAIHNLSKFCSLPIIADANEAFTDVEACIYFFEKIKKKNIEFIEQPMPAAMTEESLYLKKYSPFRLFADESIITDVDFASLKKMFDGVNIKLMKAGGYINAIRLLHEAKHHGMQTMIGCMVETTLGISSAMKLCSLADYADLDSFLLIEQEPFNLVEEKNGKLFFKNTGS